MEILQSMGQPLQRFDSNCVAALDQRVEDGVIDGTIVAFAEQIVLAAHHRWTLCALNRIVVYVVSSVKCKK